MQRSTAQACRAQLRADLLAQAWTTLVGRGEASGWRCLCLGPTPDADALALAVLCLAAMVYYNTLLALIFGGLMLVGFVYFRLTHDAEITAADGELVRAC